MIHREENPNIPITPPKKRPYSRKGCRECKRRKLKCDETKPNCSHCVKAKKYCNYELQIKFSEERSYTVNKQGDLKQNSAKYQAQERLPTQVVNMQLNSYEKINQVNSNLIAPHNNHILGTTVPTHNHSLSLDSSLDSLSQDIQQVSRGAQDMSFEFQAPSVPHQHSPEVYNEPMMGPHPNIEYPVPYLYPDLTSSLQYNGNELAVNLSIPSMLPSPPIASTDLPQNINEYQSQSPFLFPSQYGLELSSTSMGTTEPVPNLNSRSSISSSTNKSDWNTQGLGISNSISYSLDELSSLNFNTPPTDLDIIDLTGANKRFNSE